MPERLSGTVTFLFTDIEGSTALLRQLGRTAYAEVLSAQQRLLRREFAHHAGDEIDTQGDSFFVAFRSAADAVAAAAAIQRALATHAWPGGASVRVREGIHTGEATIASERYLGVSVHRAARIGAAGHGGQVVLSETTRALLADEELPGIGLRDLGEHRLKGLDRVERLYQLEIEGLPNEFPPLRTEETTEGTDAVPAIEYRILGPLEVLDSGSALPLGAEKLRAVLALLLLNANRVVSRERLVDEIWGDNPPNTVVTSVQVYVSQLRKLLPPKTLVTRSPGYMLTAEPETIDLLRFERMFADGRDALAAGNPERASRSLREALELWRGPPLAELAAEPFARIEGGRLEDLRLAVIEARVEADLALGRHAELIGELEVLIVEEPHRERLREQLMLALYRSGRQPEALEAFREARATLDEIGLEPSERLRELERAILTQDAALVPRPTLIGQAVELPGPLRAVSPFPFVGRTKELAALRSALAHAEHGEGGQVVVIGGEAGSGKTRLARELAHEAAARGTLVLYGASNADVNIPYQPFVEALEFLLRVYNRAALDECIGERRDDLARLVPGLEGSAESAAYDPQTARRRLHNAVSGLLARVSRQRPLLLVADDIHWADAPSVELLLHLTRAASEGRLCLLATYRDRSEDLRPELATALADLARQEGITRVTLDALSSDDIAEFVARSSGATATGDLTEAMRAMTDGTPFLLCELWRALNEADIVDFSGADIRLTRPIAELSSPKSVRDVVHYRLSRLAPETTAMLEVAAVAGTEFELNVLGDERTVLSAAEEAVESGMIEAVSEPGLAHRFTHELVRRALYDRLPSVRRAELHLRVGESLERVHGANLDRFVADLAHHFTLAAPVAGVDRAIHYNIRAAEAAAAALAYGEAATHLATAVDFGIADPRERARVGFDLGTALLQCGRLDESEAALARSIDDATAVGEEGLRAHALVLRHEVRLRTDAPAARAETRELAEDAMETFTRLGDNGGLAEAWRLLSRVHSRECHWAAATAALDTALRHARRSGDAREIAKVVTWLVISLYYGPVAAPDAIRRCEQLLVESGSDRYVEAVTSCLLAGLFAMTRRFDDARFAGERGLATLDELGLTIAAAHARVYVSEAALLAGDFDAAEHELRIAYEITERAGDLSGGFAFELANLLCAQGRHFEANEWVAKGHNELERSDVMTRVAGLAVEGELAAHRGSVAKGLSLAHAAVVQAAQTDALNIRARALVSQSAVLDVAGRVEDARSARRNAIGLYEAKGNVAAAQAVATISSSASV